MKIGTRGHDILTDNIDDIIAYCHKHQIDGLHLALYKSFAADFKDTKLMQSYLEKLKTQNIEIFVHGAYFNMVHPTQTKVKDGLELFNTVAKYAKTTDCLYVGSETGSLNGDEWTLHENNHTKDTINASTKIIQKLVDDNPDVKVLIEPVYDHIIFDLKNAQNVQQTVGADIILDLSNLLMKDNYTDYLNIFESALKMFANHIKILHLKNFNMIDGNKHYTRLDQGYLDYEKLISLLRKYDLLDIPLVVEDLTGEDLEQSIKYIRSL